MEKRSVLISGCGVAGPAAAFWLSRHGFEPTIVETAPALRTGGYAIDFWGAGFDVAERMGVLPALRPHDLRIGEVQFVNRRGKKNGGFKADAVRSMAGGRFMSLLRSDLARVLYEAVRDRAECIFGDEIAALAPDEGGVEVKFRFGMSRRFDLVIGADGLHSGVRRLAFGPEENFEHDYGYFAAAFTVSDYPHKTSHAYVCFSVPGKQVARYLLADGKTGVLFLFSQAGSAAGRPRDRDSQIRLVQKTFAGEGWECPALLERIGEVDDFYFDPVSQIRMPAWSKGRITLLGDAGYCPSLLSGQGSALAMAGAYILAGELKAAGGDHVRAFQEYEKKFRPFMEAKQRSAKRFAGSLVPKSWPGIWLRNQVTRMMFLPVVSRKIFASFMKDRIELEEYG